MHARMHTCMCVRLYVCMHRAHDDLTYLCMDVCIYHSVHVYAGARGHRSDNHCPGYLLHVMDQDKRAVPERLPGALQHSQSAVSMLSQMFSTSPREGVHLATRQSASKLWHPSARPSGPCNANIIHTYIHTYIHTHTQDQGPKPYLHINETPSNTAVTLLA